MKLAIILGVGQMSLGIALKGLNAIRMKGRWMDLWFEAIPQAIMFGCLFGYMCLLILVKCQTVYPDKSHAPSIITFFIDMMLGMG
jgi:V-type H+-transporting ATPase subunit a